MHVVLGDLPDRGVPAAGESGPTSPLLPFAGLGSLAAAAELALPFLLDQLAAIPGAVGEVVGGVGDALALRSGTPLGFDGDALTAWAADPVSALTTAVPSIIETGLTTLAPLVDAVVPPGVAVTGTRDRADGHCRDRRARLEPERGTRNRQRHGDRRARDRGALVHGRDRRRGARRAESHRRPCGDRRGVAGAAPVRDRRGGRRARGRSPRYGRARARRRRAASPLAGCSTRGSSRSSPATGPSTPRSRSPTRRPSRCAPSRP